MYQHIHPEQYQRRKVITEKVGKGGCKVIRIEVVVKVGRGSTTSSRSESEKGAKKKKTWRPWSSTNWAPKNHLEGDLSKWRTGGDSVCSEKCCSSSRTGCFNVRITKYKNFLVLFVHQTTFLKKVVSGAVRIFGLLCSFISMKIVSAVVKSDLPHEFFPVLLAIYVLLISLLTIYWLCWHFSKFTWDVDSHVFFQFFIVWKFFNFCESRIPVFTTCSDSVADSEVIVVPAFITPCFESLRWENRSL